MKNKVNFEKLVHFIYSEDAARNKMPVLKATKLLEDIKNLIEKHSKRG
jgi:hypothetical protein